jgi:hypothetical protein
LQWPPFYPRRQDYFLPDEKPSRFPLMVILTQIGTNPSLDAFGGSAKIGLKDLHLLS